MSRRRKKKPPLLISLTVLVVIIEVLLAVIVCAGILFIGLWYISIPAFILICFFFSKTKKNSSGGGHRLFLIDANMHMPEMSGLQFERFCARLIEYNGYSKVRETPGSGDHGADIIAEKDGKTYAFQCKHYEKPVGNKAVQEAFTARAYYRVDYAVVITNSSFTRQARTEAERIGVELWDKYYLGSLISKIENDIYPERKKKETKSAIIKMQKTNLYQHLSEILIIVLIIILLIVGIAYLYTNGYISLH